jgi:hemerythrin-like domain-containing protein
MDTSAGRPTDVLEAEHRAIERVVLAAVKLADALEAGGSVGAETMLQLVEFMRTYADKCHHGKEEAELFPMLARRGVPIRGCPLGTLTGEHIQGRALVAALHDAAVAQTAGDPAAREAVSRSLRGISVLYPNHIWKEDYLLIPMCGKVLSPADQAELRARFDRADQAMGSYTIERFERAATDIEGQVLGL